MVRDMVIGLCGADTAARKEIAREVVKMVVQAVALMMRLPAPL